MILNTPFVQVALPIIVTFIVAAWLNGKRLDDFKVDMNRRFDAVDRRFEAVDRRFDRLENLLGDHSQRIVRLEERTSPLAR